MHLNVDNEAEKIGQELIKFDAIRSFEAVHRTLDKLLREKCTRPVDVLDSDEVENYLNGCRRVIEKDLIEKAQVFSPARWIWYIRRLPAMKMMLATSDPYDKGLLQCIACLSDASESNSKAEIKKNRLVFP